MEGGDTAVVLMQMTPYRRVYNSKERIDLKYTSYYQSGTKLGLKRVK
jgi:hypothetical protein